MLMAAQKTTANKIVRAAETSTGDSTRRLFFVSVMNMTWQLAVVVLVPIGGGYALDKKLQTLPVLTIIGFILAIVCMVIVVQRLLRAFGPPPEDSVS